jgi:hypothetical protein
MNLLSFYIFLQIFFIPFFANAQIEKTEYLINNHQALSPEMAYSLIDSNNFQSKVFLFGEIHEMEENRELEFQFLKRLYLKEHVRVIVFEIPYSDQFLLNSYFKDGNRFDLFRLSNGIKGDLKKNEKLFTSIFEFNNTLSDSNKLIFRAIDIEHNKWGAIDRLNMLLPKNVNPPEEISGLIKVLAKLETKRFHPLAKEKKIDDFVLKMSQSLLESESLYKKYLNSEYFNFKKIIRGLKIKVLSCKKYGCNYAASLEREAELYQNFVELINEFPNEKFYGQFGRLHVALSYQKNWGCTDNWTSFAAMLNSNQTSSVKGMVCSTVYYYLNDRSGYGPTEWCSPVITDFSLFSNLCSSSETLFKLDSSNSPFLSMAEIYQYLLIIKR